MQSKKLSLITYFAAFILFCIINFLFQNGLLALLVSAGVISLRAVYSIGTIERREYLPIVAFFESFVFFIFIRIIPTLF